MAAVATLKMQSVSHAQHHDEPHGHSSPAMDYTEGTQCLIRERCPSCLGVSCAGEAKPRRMIARCSRPAIFRWLPRSRGGTQPEAAPTARLHRWSGANCISTLWSVETINSACEHGFRGMASDLYGITDIDRAAMTAAGEESDGAAVMMIMIELIAGEYAWSSIGKQLRQKDW